jgi:hypothetical protein
VIFLHNFILFEDLFAKNIKGDNIKQRSFFNIFDRVKKKISKKFLKLNIKTNTKYYK